MLLFVVLSWQIEEKYGAWRVAFIFFWSALGGESIPLLPTLLLILNLFGWDENLSLRSVAKPRFRLDPVVQFSMLL